IRELAARSRDVVLDDTLCFRFLRDRYCSDSGFAVFVRIDLSTMCCPVPVGPPNRTSDLRIGCRTSDFRIGCRTSDLRIGCRIRTAESRRAGAVARPTRKTRAAPWWRRREIEKRTETARHGSFAGKGMQQRPPFQVLDLAIAAIERLAPLVTKIRRWDRD